MRINQQIPVVVTVSPRSRAIHQRTFAAARAAGFDRIYATCEPVTDTTGIDADQITINQEQLGQWRNFIQALRMGIATEAEHFITLEDDVELCRGSCGLIQRLGWPADDCGCLQLYSAEPMGVYPVGRRSRLRPEHALDMLGACALMFRRDAAQLLVKWADEKGWRGHAACTINVPDEKEGADTFVGEVLTVTGYSIWSHNPSLADHIGKASTLKHDAYDSPNRRPLAFPGIEADLTKIFAEEINAAHCTLQNV